MSKELKKVCIIVSKDSLDMAYPPFIIATTAAAMGAEAHLFFTFWGLNVITKRGIEKLKLPSEKINFEAFMKKKMPKLTDLIKRCKEMGVKLYACSTTAEMMGITKDKLLDEVEDIVGAAKFLDIAADADITLFV